MNNNLNLEYNKEIRSNPICSIVNNVEVGHWEEMKVKLEKIWSHTLETEREIKFTGKIVSCWIEALIEGNLLPGKLYTISELANIYDYPFPGDIDCNLATVNAAFNATGYPSHLFESEFWLRDDNYLPHVKLSDSVLRLMKDKDVVICHPNTKKIINNPEDKIFIEFRVNCSNNDD